MDLSINGRGIDVGEALRSYVTDGLGAAVSKYFGGALDSTVTISREAHLFRAVITVHPGRGVTLQGHAGAEDAYVAFDGALERITKQLRRYKRRLNDRQKQRGADEVMLAQQYIIAPEPEEEELPPDGQPAVIAEQPTEIAALTVSEAVMRMDLADSPALVFRNRAHGRLNVVYRRTDGNIGWIDPTGAPAS
jgi:ribosomal subunit interface protein